MMKYRLRPRRVIAAATWDASPAKTSPMRWSELAPPVVPKQTLVSVELSDGDSTCAGVASLTHYAYGSDRVLDAPLEAWIGAEITGLAGSLANEANLYEPASHPLRAVFELATLDALGKLTGLPASAFLGGVRRADMEAYASLPSFSDPDRAVACARAAVERGFRAVKLHASGALDWDLETVALARAELGQSVQLMWDGSRAYDLYSAVVIGTALDEARYLWFEAPLPDDSHEGLRPLAARISVPLVPDGLAQRSSADWARDVYDGVWGALRVDITRTPDLAGAVRLLRLAESVGLPCEVQSFGFPLSQWSNLQLTLASDACRYFEVPFPLEDFDDPVVEGPVVIDGRVRAPERPGLGHGLEAAKLAGCCRLLARAALHGTPTEQGHPLTDNM